MVLLPMIPMIQEIPMILKKNDFWIYINYLLF